MNAQSHYSVPGIFYPPPFATAYYPGGSTTINTNPSSQEHNGHTNNSSQANDATNSSNNIDDEQQYESASIIYGPRIPWPPSPSPLHLATQTPIQYPRYVGYYGDLQNEGTYDLSMCYT